MFDALIAGLLLVFQWPTFGFLCLGVFMGIWLGAVPGLGGIIGLVLLLPFTYTMDPVPALALLLGMFAVTSTSDTISSVLLGIPGTAASQATILDGYPLAQQGKAARAFGAAFTVSAFGGVFSAIILAVSLPVMLPVILAFSAPEFFMLGLVGLAMVGSLSGGSLLKGLTVVALGILMSTVGYAETIPIPRYNLGLDYLLDDLPLLPIVLGLFALPELMELAIRNTSISRGAKAQSVDGGMLEGIRDAFRHWWLALRCAIIGTWVGMLPGIGAAVVDWIAYGHAVQSAKDKSKFGSGDIRGVIAPESANNATRGGSLIPMVAFGIPGSLSTAILLGALLIQGLRPGPDMLTTHLHVTFSMVWAIAIANVMASILLILLTRQISRVAFLSGHLIVPGVILFIFMGAWLGGSHIGNWILCIAMGVVGVIMKRGGWPRPPLVLAVILGPLLENSFRISMQAYDAFSWLYRPVVLVLAVVLILTIALAARSKAQNMKTGEKATGGEGSERSPVISLPFAIILTILFIWAGVHALNWPAVVSQFPLLATVTGACLGLFVLISDGSAFKTTIAESGGFRRAFAAVWEKALLGPTTSYFAYLIAMLLLALVIGQKLAIPLFIFFYLVRWGHFNTFIALAYALTSWLVLVAFYDRVMHVIWHHPLIEAFLPGILPLWLPEWLIV